MEPTAVVAERGRIRRALERWRKTAGVATGLLLGEIGARIGLPGVDGGVLSDYFHRVAGGGLLGLYDRLVGGALSRGAVLGLGIMPYVSARIFVRIARTLSPSIGEMWEHQEGRTTLTRWTRGLTVGLGLVQSYGFARFVQSIPGVVAHPGAGFIAQTMAVLTAGALVGMWIGERISARDETDAPAREADQPLGVPSLPRDDAGQLLLQPGAYDVAEIYKPRPEAVRVPRNRSD
jgi:preprotein translocase subunit SecY